MSVNPPPAESFTLFPVVLKTSWICCGVKVTLSVTLFHCLSRANAPATWGVDIEVPLFVEVPPVCDKETMLVPGARRSVRLLMLLKLEIASPFVVEPTAVAFLMHAGASICVMLPSFPDAAVTLIFRATAEFMEFLK